MDILLKKFRSSCLILGIIATIIFPKVSYAYPVFAQNAYENPREATGRIVCANCHLAQGSIQLNLPQAVLPRIIFEIKVHISYDFSITQLLRNGKQSSLNIGAVLILPNDFQLVPANRVVLFAVLVAIAYRSRIF